MTPIDDTDFEATDETVIVTLTADAAYILGTPDTDTVNISSNDETFTVSISASDAAGAEAGVDTGTFAVSLDKINNTGSTITVNYLVTGTATATDDYVALVGTVDIADGQQSADITVTPVDDIAFEGDETVIVTLDAGTGYELGTAVEATVTITSDDLATVSITATDALASETGPDAGEFTVSLDAVNNTGADITVLYGVSGTATADADYTALSGSVIIADGQQSATIGVTPIDDIVTEGAENVVLTISSNVSYNLGDPVEATVLISDNDNPSISISDVTLAEGDAGTTTYTFTVSIDGGGNAVSDITFAINTSDVSATASTDYTAIVSGSGTIATGNSSTTINVTVNGDSEVEGNETFLVVISNPNNATILDDTGIGTIANDDSAILTISDVSAAENVLGAELVFTVTIDNAVVGGVTVAYSFTNGTAINGTDFTGTEGTLSFAGTAGEIQTIVVPLIDDSIVESDETFTVTLGSPSNVLVGTSGSPAIGTITNDDSATLTISDVSVAENVAGGELVFTVTLDNAVAGGTTVAYSFTNGSAINDTDFTGANGILTFVGVSGEIQTIVVPVIDDGIVESDETFTVTLDLPSNVLVGTSGSPAIGAITNDDSAILTISDVSVAENVAGGELVFTVTLDNEVVGGTTVAYTISGGTATNGTDFTGTNGTLTFTGTAGEEQIITVSILDDTVVEGDETFTVTLGSTSNVLVGTSGSPATGTITNDDTVTVAFSSATYSDVEGAGGNLPSLFVTGTVTAPTSVTITVSGGNANGGGVDYTINSPQVVTIDAGTYDGTSATAIAIPTLSITDDVVVEADETISLSLSAPTGDATIGTIGTTTYTIINDDIVTVSFANTEISVNESVTNVQPTLFITGTVSEVSMIRVSLLTGGTASGGGVDYSFISPQIVTIPTGLYDGTVNTALSIPTLNIVNDDIVEGNETIVFGLSNPMGDVSLGNITSTTFTIIDDETANLSISDLQVTEDVGVALVSITLDKTIIGGTQVSYSIDNGTAINGIDFNGVNGVLTFAGNAGETQDVTVNILDDSLVEEDESFTITLGTPTNGVSVNGSPATITIGIDDTATLTVSDVSVSENNPGELIFNVVLDNPVQGGVSVNYNFSDGTALNNIDFTGTDGTLAFTGNAGEERTISVSILDDNLVEPDETFNIILGAPSNSAVSVLGSPAIGTIINDDVATLTVNNVSVAENLSGGSLQFTVSLNTPVAGGFTLPYSFEDGTAINGTDFIGANGELTFLGNTSEVRTITVPILNEEIVEGDETFTLILGTPSKSSINIIGSPATGTIINDDSVTISFSSASESDLEASGGNLPTLLISGTVTAATTVTVTAIGGDAAGGGIDYSFTSPQVITIPADIYDGTAATAITISTLSITDDASVEGDETIIFELSSPTGDAVLGDNLTTTTYTILNDDSVTVEFSSATYSDVEGTGGNLPTLVVTGTVTAATTVTVTATGGDAAGGGVDYSFASPQVITIPADTYDGTTATAITIPTLSIRDDAIVEENETIIFELSAPTGDVTLGSTITSTTYIILNDDTVSVSFSGSASTDNENTGGNLPTLRVEGTVTAPTTVTVSVTGGSASAGADYIFTSPQIITIPAGVYDGTTTTAIPISIVDDTVVETDETIVFSLNTPTGDAILAAPAAYTYTILDTDTTSLSVSDIEVGENIFGGQIFVTVTLDNEVSEGVQVSYSFTDGTATGGGIDYISSPGTLTFSGNTGEGLTIPVQIVNDGLAEISEDFSIELQVVSNSRVTLSQATVTVTILNDDPNRISIADLTQSEGNSGNTAFNFTVSLEDGTQALQDISFNYSTTAGTADYQSDYQEIIQGSGFIASGESSTTIPVLVVGDGDLEPNETFIITLSNPIGAQITDGSAIGTIQNDDQCDAGDVAPLRNALQSLEYCTADIIPSLTNFVISNPQNNNILTFTRNPDLLDATGYLIDAEIAAPEIGTVYAFYLDPVNNCASPSIAITLVRNTTPVLTLVQGDERCGPGELLLQAAGGIPNSLTGVDLNWYDAAQEGNLIYTGDSFTVNVSQTTTYWVEAFANGCSSERQQVLARIVQPVTTGIASDAFACSVAENGTFLRDLDDRLIGASAGVWSIETVPSGATVFIAPGNLVTFVGQPGGDYVFRFTTTGAEAPCVNDTVLVTVSVTDCDVDSDGDGILDGVEESLGTNPLLPDTDGDGVNDGDEVGEDISNPLDTDQDGTIDALESDILDADGDGYSDQQDPADDNPCIPNAASNLCEIDLQVLKSASTLQAAFGDEITFTVTLNNLSETEVYDIEVGELLQSGFLYLSHTASLGTYDPNTGGWIIPNLAGSGSATLQITVRVVVNGTYSNTAELLDSLPIDNNSSNDSATVVVQTTQATDVDLEITQRAQIFPNGVFSDTQINALAGNQIKFEITVTNLSETDAVSNIQIEDLLNASSGFDYVSYDFPQSTSAQDAYNASTGIWNINNLDAGQSTILSIIAVVPSQGSFINTASLANPEDANNSNNSASVRVQVSDQSSYPPGFIFNQFSPNGDGINDVLKIKLTEKNQSSGIEETVISSFNIQIFNRYGQLILDGTGLRNAEIWDGTFNGKDAPAGTYFYVLQFSLDSAEGATSTTEKGWIQLIR